MHFIPGLRISVSEHTEYDGVDEHDMGEYAYDYVGLEKELSTIPAHRAGEIEMGNVRGGLAATEGENSSYKERRSVQSRGET